MTLPFLLFANLVLLLRLPLLMGDAPASWRGWAVKALAELLLLASFVPVPMLGVLAGGVIVLNTVEGWWDRRRGERAAGHLGFGAVELMLASICLSQAGGVELRAGWQAAVQLLREWSALGGLPALLLTPTALKVIFGLLLAANEANLFIRWSLGRLHLRPGVSAPAELDPQEYSRGRVIGMIERVLIFAFVFSGQYGAVGFTLAAKGFTRFKELENRGFAEYVLIGTLLSSGLAMLAALFAKALLW
jgi:hypothetical protein